MQNDYPKFGNVLLRNSLIILVSTILISCSSKKDLTGTWDATVNQEKIASIQINDTLFQTDKGDINITTCYYRLIDNKLILHRPMEEKASAFGKLAPSSLSEMDTFTLEWEGSKKVKLMKAGGNYSYIERANEQQDELNLTLFKERLKLKLEREWTSDSSNVNAMQQELNGNQNMDTPEQLK